MEKHTKDHRSPSGVNTRAGRRRPRSVRRLVAAVAFASLFAIITSAGAAGAAQFSSWWKGPHAECSSRGGFQVNHNLQASVDGEIALVNYSVHRWDSAARKWVFTGEKSGWVPYRLQSDQRLSDGSILVTAQPDWSAIGDPAGNHYAAFVTYYRRTGTGEYALSQYWSNSCMVPVPFDWTTGYWP